MKTITKSVTLALCLFAVTAQVQSAENQVEILLADELDEARGYCLDIAGGQGKNAPLDKGLQAHTCYHYTGGILEDQGFDQALIGEGRFRIPYFDVCMAVPSIEAGAPVILGQCTDADTEKFTLKDSGHLVTQANPDLCVTVSSTEKREGRGGSPVHVMRPLSLEPCDESNNAYQTWTLYNL